MLIIDVTAAVIFMENRVLMTTRPVGKHLEGYWEFPGGKVDLNETHYSSLIRELNEEIGVSVIPLDKMCVIRHNYPEKKVRLSFYRCIPESSESFNPVPNEYQKIGYFDLEELDELNIVPADKPLVDYIKLILDAKQSLQ